MQSSQAINTQSTLKGNGNLSSLSQPLPTDSPSPWSYHTLPLNLFIEQVDNGTVDQSIYEQFLDAIKDKEQSYIQKLIKEINLLDVAYSCAQLCIQYYEQINDPEVFNVIVKLVPLARTTDTLELILTRSKKMLTDLELKKKELDNIMPEGGGSLKPDRKYFSQLTLQLSKHLKFQIDKRNTTVAEFADMIVDLRETAEAMDREMNKHKK